MSASTDGWRDLAAFRAADRRRAASREVEIGSAWRTAADRPSWRAVWLEATGEVVAVELVDGPTGPVRLLGVVPERGALEIGLRGWWNTCGWPGSLSWLSTRVAELASQRSG